MDLEAKIRELERMAQEDPHDALTFFMLGSALLTAGRLDEAAAALEQSLRLDPDRPPCVRQLADAYRKQGRRPEARLRYEQAIALAEKTGDLQVAREARAVLTKLDRSPS